LKFDENWVDHFAISNFPSRIPPKKQSFVFQNSNIKIYSNNDGRTSKSQTNNKLEIERNNEGMNSRIEKMGNKMVTVMEEK
jgi:hypothetical protein